MGNEARGGAGEAEGEVRFMVVARKATHSPKLMATSLAKRKQFWGKG